MLRPVESARIGAGRHMHDGADVGRALDAERMRATLDRSADSVLAERRTIAGLLDATADSDPTTYRGFSEDLIVGAVERAQTFLEENE